MKPTVLFLVFVLYFGLLSNALGQNPNIINAPHDYVETVTNRSSAGEKIRKLELQRYMGMWTIFLLSATLVYLTVLLRKQRKKNELLKEELRLKPADYTKNIVDSYFKGQEEERQRISRELHDGACSALVGVRATLASLNHEDDALYKATDWLTCIHRDLRNMSHDLSPKELLHGNLQSALRTLAMRMNEQTGKHITLQQSDEVDWSQTYQADQLMVYRVIQEILGNILKHSNATSIFLSLLPEFPQLSISIEDNGTNFNSNTTAGNGFGNIQQRLSLVKGNLDVGNSKQGTTYLITAQFRNKVCKGLDSRKEKA